MGSAEKFCLKWNDFETNISVAFRELRDEKDFFDVTLACEDSQVQAHKVILSACSSFFRNVLRRNPHQHPLLYLKGVKYKELVSVLNFMYMGEVNVAQEELNSFLTVAEDLCVKGLTQGGSTSNKDSNLSSKRDSVSRSRKTTDRLSPEAPPSKRSRPSGPTSNIGGLPANNNLHTEDDEIQEVVPVKSEPRDSATPSATAVTTVEPAQAEYVDTAAEGQVALDQQYQDESYDYEEYDDGGYDDGGEMIDPNTGMPINTGSDGNKGTMLLLPHRAGGNSAGTSGMDCESDPNPELIDLMIQERMTSYVGPDGRKTWRCNECPYTTRSTADMRKHIERKHLDCLATCKLCGRSFNCRYRLQQHHRKVHA